MSHICWVSTGRDVVLQSVTKATSGEYQCEVIGEHPKFRKETRRARLTIFCNAISRDIMENKRKNVVQAYPKNIRDATGSQ
ncbi:hypothetical protein E2C01_023587 [Portunus trituberculatus]|uniref:Ig-like domain-containing protein n=1 Tax=Portunus trituberculatus TaxID=210409 RepID=A0A5B7EAE1_PORTR|nr:hypothetical protein [Portunus trituberculatus]